MLEFRMLGVMAGIEQRKALVTGDPDLNENGAAGPSSAVEWDANLFKQEAPDSLRRLSEALEGWKNKQEKINKKFLESFEQIGTDLSKIRTDTGHLQRTYDDIRKSERKPTLRSASHQRTTLDLPPQSNEP